VDEIYGLHNQPEYPAGVIATKPGALMGSVATMIITITGQGGHGAVPQASIDPIVAASAVVMNLQSIVSRELSPFDPVVVTIGTFHAGTQENIIPGEAVLTGTVRTLNPQVQDVMEEKIRRIVTDTVAAYRCTVDVAFDQYLPVLVNADVQTDVVNQIIDEQLGAAYRTQASSWLGGEDFALYLLERPGCFLFLGSGSDSDPSHNYGLHHPKFNLNEACLPLGASLLAAIGVSRLEMLGNG
jgi:amidohydrolase